MACVVALYGRILKGHAMLLAHPRPTATVLPNAITNTDTVIATERVARQRSKPARALLQQHLPRLATIMCSPFYHVGAIADP